MPTSFHIPFLYDLNAYCLLLFISLFSMFIAYFSSYSFSLWSECLLPSSFYIPFLYTACSLKLLLSTIERGSNEPGVNFFLLSMTTYKTMRFKKFTVHLKARQFRGAMPIPSDSLFRLKPAAFIWRIQSKNKITYYTWSLKKRDVKFLCWW